LEPFRPQGLRINRHYSVPHKSTIERLLPALGARVVQFVYCRSEMVELIGASDLNKPLGRMVWLSSSFVFLELLDFLRNPN
jgi:hypothetical protein